MTRHSFASSLFDLFLRAWRRGVSILAQLRQYPLGFAGFIVVSAVETSFLMRISSFLSASFSLSDRVCSIRSLTYA